MSNSSPKQNNLADSQKSTSVTYTEKGRKYEEPAHHKDFNPTISQRGGIDLIDQELASIIPATDPSSTNWKWKIFFGVIIVVLIAFSHTGSTQFAKTTYTKNFQAPFFVTWYNTCFMIMVYPFFMIPLMCQKTPWRLRTFLRHTALIFGPDGFSLKSLVNYWLRRIIPFCMIWIGTNYVYIRSLRPLLPGTVTAIFSVSSCFVYILSLIFLRDRFYLLRVVAMFLTICGIVLMGYVEGFGIKATSYQGIIFVMLAAFGSALYQVFFKRVMADATGSQVALFLTLLGSTNMILFSPVLFLMDYLEWEVITWDTLPWVHLNTTAILSAFFNYLVNFGISITFPLFISIGISLGLPMNAIADSIFRHEEFGVLKIVSLFLILAGFLLMLIPSDKLKKMEKNLFSCFCSSNEVADANGDIAGDENI